ncbi:phage holin family protein [Silvimonas sp.]|uniref:phage holin family protein n=1 Tax=Silvimonas sp. TaxID=2650811 RepID=UPI0028515878|nr:phage holin family protein [Silvimonas sp.]MDR3429025.1 phage holin family protein [Silvimonas sp.]
MTFISLLTAMLALLIAIRLLTYDRKGATFRRHISFIAWMLLVCCIDVTIGVFCGWYRNIPPGIALLMTLLCIRVWRRSGNIADVLRGL